LKCQLKAVDNKDYVHSFDTGTVGEIVDTLDRDKVDTFSSVPCYGFLVFFKKLAVEGAEMWESRVFCEISKGRWKGGKAWFAFPPFQPRRHFRPRSAPRSDVKSRMVNS
jgi:hypothetical protein